MTVVNVFFDLPEHIRKGLAAHKYAREGGVIVDTATHQVVKWLDEVDPPTLASGSEVTSLLHVGASILTRASAAMQMAAIERKLALIADGVQELLSLSHDERRSKSSACVEDLLRRFRKGEPVSHDLLREIRASELRVSSLMKRAATEGIEKARDEGSAPAIFVKFLLFVPGILGEMAADRRAGQMGAFIAALFDEYCAISFARGLALTQIAPEELPSWADTFQSMLTVAAVGMLKGATPWFYRDEFQWSWTGTPTPHKIISSADGLLKADSRQCPEEYLPTIRSGLYLVADLLELAQEDHLLGEIHRTGQRLHFMSDKEKGRQWWALRGGAEERAAFRLALSSLEPGIVTRVADDLFGEANVTLAVTTDAQQMRSRLASQGGRLLVDKLTLVE
jgi:hypothetical protein